MSSRPTRFPTISPVANTSPVVSTAVISMTTIIEMIARDGELRHAEVERRGDAEPGRGVADLVEVRVAQRSQADAVPIDQAEQHRDRGQEALEEPLDHAR